MSLTSPNDRKDLAKLTSDLSPALLLDLACDLLFIRGHKEIRITDGPGDGARDIHSIAPNKRRFITQCKYHQNPDLSVRTREMAELPISLIKFGYTDGLFLTNARITPQSKREYLNDYSQFSLDFVDGITLIRELRSDTILNARWIESSGGSWPYVVSYPIIFRRHDGDSPFIPCAVHGYEIHAVVKLALNTKPREVDISIAIELVSEGSFSQ